MCLHAEKVEGQGHTAELTVRDDAKLLPNSDTFIVECINDYTICTTGNSNLDTKIFGKDSLSELNQIYSYQFQGMTPPQNPTKSNSEGKINPIRWKSFTPKEQNRKWLALNYFQPTSSLGTGEEQTHQLGTFSFEETANNTDCVTLRWDPYGRIFDAVTLEPIKNANVYLYKKEADGSFRLFTNVIGGIINPQKTLEDGVFSFVVPDATYKLVVSLNNYEFPVTEISDIHPNYEKIYSNIYPTKTGVEIIQKGAIVHRDIPVKPLSISQNNNVKLISHFEDLDKTNSILYVKGLVSHPFAKIIVYSLKNNNNQPIRHNKILETNANKSGDFNFKVDLKKFEAGEFYGELVINKINLTESNLLNLLLNKLSSWLKIKVNAQTISTSYRFSPILNYIEGYAYDNKGKIISNAKVNVVLNFSNKPYYSTQTDDKGYFKISSANLPSMPYKLVFTSSTGIKYEQNTSDFILKNNNFIKANNINLNSKVKITTDSSQITQATDSPRPTFFTTEKDQSQEKSLDNSSQKPDSLSNKTNRNNLVLLILAILFLLIIIVFVLIYFYIKKKQQLPPSTF